MSDEMGWESDEMEFTEEFMMFLKIHFIYLGTDLVLDLYFLNIKKIHFYMLQKLNL